MVDLGAASLDDVQGFFRTLLRPQQRHLGDRRRHRSGQDEGAGRAVLRLRSRPAAPFPGCPRCRCGSTAPKRIAMEAKIQQPQLYVAYPSPANFTPGDRELDVLANVLGGGKSSRLYKRLVYELEDRPVGDGVPTEPAPRQQLRDHGVADARPHARRDPGRGRSGDRRVCRSKPVDAAELARAKNQIESDTVTQPRGTARARRAAPALQPLPRRSGLPDRGPAPLPGRRRRRRPGRRADSTFVPTGE